MANAFIWPTVAYLRAKSARTPLVTEHQNLVMFVILLPDTSSEEAMMISTRIMEATAVITAQPESELSLTLSIGVASARPEMNDVADWLKAADDALYEAKRRGKNQIYAH